MRYLSGDFNGDGITDIIAINQFYENNNIYRCLDPNTGKLTYSQRGGGGPNCIPNPARVRRSVYYINLDPNDKIDSSIPAGSSTNSIGTLKTDDKVSRLLTGDYNGDGKTDIFHISEGKIEIYSLDNNNKLVHVSTVVSESIKIKDTVFLPGDFNGDGKTDLISSISEGNRSWGFFISDGKNYTYYKKDIGLDYWNNYFDENYSGYKSLENPEEECFSSGKNKFKIPCYKAASIIQYFYLPVDFNKDGKTDLIKHKVVTPYFESGDSRYSSQWIDYATNESTANDFLGFSFKNEFIKHNKGRPGKGHPVYADLSKGNLMDEYGFVSYSGEVNIYKYTGNYRNELCIQSVENNGLIQAFNYKGLKAINGAPDFASHYTKRFSENFMYPYIEINSADDFKVVVNAKETFSGLERTKFYRYGGLVSSTNGLGLLGFNFMASSTWSGADIRTLWTISQYSPKKRGVLEKTWTTNKAVHNATSFPSSGFVSKTNYIYDYVLNSNKTYLNIPKKVVSENGLTGINTTVTNTYDSYYNVLTSKETYTGGSKTITNTYFNNPSGTGVNYYIGRPKTKNTTTTLGSDSFSTGEQYSYTNNFIKTLKTKGNGTSWLTETYEHDGFGNITSKTISGAGIEDRKEESVYDSTGRFMESATDIEGLTVSYKYDKKLGHLLEETDPFGKKQKFEYDGWNRLTKQTDFLGNTIETNYWQGPTEGDIRVSTLSSLGTLSLSYSNRLGWEYESAVTNALGEYVYTKVEYDAVGKIKRESQPYFSDPSQWTTHSYDQYNRPIRQQMYTGQIVTTTYGDGTNSVSVDDGTKTMSTVKDAVGNTISMTDPGGTINYSYYANNTPKETNYGSHKITTKIDGWGRKIELNDPAAGVYSYKYNILGELLEERHANGTTTYEYDEYGKPTKKLIVGKETDMELIYEYYDDSK
ncbi:FG-GAP-like repeat-containing protein [Aquimarina agarilytica]|uniref:FG-GAP-like repeat-containing protein n=1 Tax=Aquimarina agarilytica TaxID=1087449 RepID=UPI0021CDA3DA|nr:FG-GAP-like repeat-containing protein [Aquimarina agarilytica]